MNRKFQIIAAGCLALSLLISACGPGPLAIPTVPIPNTSPPKLIPTPTLVPTPVPITNIEGEWNGNGTTAQGKLFSLVFKVKDSLITDIAYRLGNSCSILGSAEGMFSSPLLPFEITGNKFSTASFGVTGKFESNTTASGNIKYVSTSDCIESFETTWAAKKK